MPPQVSAPVVDARVALWLSMPDSSSVHDKGGSSGRTGRKSEAKVLEELLSARASETATRGALQGLLSGTRHTK